MPRRPENDSESDGPATFGWRIRDLERRTDDNEKLMRRIFVTLVGNLIGLIVLLSVKAWEHYIIPR